MPKENPRGEINPQPKSEFELAIEEVTGQTVEEIRKMPMEKRRRFIEEKTGKPVELVSFWPFIGSEEFEILRHSEIEEIVDKALK